MRPTPGPSLAWTAVALFSLALAAGAQAPVLVADLDRTPVPDQGSDPTGFVTVGSFTYFAGDSRDTGRELFKTLGGFNPPVLVKDIVPGVLGSDPRFLTRVGSTLYFFAGDGFSGQSLWRSDGTTAGTVAVKDLPAESSWLTAVGSRVFFRVGTDQQSTLWVSDGTAAGTGQVGPVGLQPQQLAAVGGRLFFSGFSATGGSELWVSDGTAAGTVMVIDLWPGLDPFLRFPYSSAPLGLYAFGNRVLFSANRSDRAIAYYVSDGTAAGTVELYASSPLAVLLPIATFWATLGNRVLFGPLGSQSVFNLSITDGTRGGTFKIVDLPGRPRLLTPFAGQVCCLVANFGAQRDELWKSDGTAAGTSRVAAMDPAQRVATELVVSGSFLYFAGHRAATGVELWRSDGTVANTGVVFDIRRGTLGSEPLGLVDGGFGGVVFAAEDGVIGREPWVSDGTAAGTRPVANLWANPGGTGSSNPGSLTDHEGTAFLEVLESGGSATYVTDGTAAGTRRLATGTGIGIGRESLGAGVLFNGDLGQGRSVLRTDLTAAPVAVHREPYWGIGRLRGRVYFGGSGRTANRSTGLWATDGGPAVLVAELHPSEWSALREVTVVGGRLYFVATFGMDAWLYASDGTAAGTVRIDGGGSAVPWTSPGSLYPVGGLLVMSAWDVRRSVYRMWRSDGTAAGTAPLDDPSGVSPTPADAGLVVGDVLYFAAVTSAQGKELWRTDGTNAGTRLVRDIHPGTGAPAGHLDGMAGTGSVLFFPADDGVHGVELWRSDGTAAGTSLVLDVNPGAPGMLGILGSAEAMLAVQDRVFFNATDGVHGVELWQSDGTAAGTGMVADLWPGSAGSLPRSMLLSRGQLLFVADDGKLGRELWRLDPGASAAPIGAGCGANQVPGLRATAPRLGAGLSIRVEQARGARGVLLVGTLPLRPTDLGGGCSLHPDLAGPLFPILFTPDAAGRFTLNTTVPNDPTLDGLALPLQAGVGPSTNPPLGTDLSHALLLSLRR